MAWIIDDKFKTRALDGALDIFDEGTADANGDIQLTTAADVELAQPQLSNPAFGAAAMNGAVSEADANTITDDTTVLPAGGTIGKIKVRDRDNVVRVEGTVGVSGSNADMILIDNVVPPNADFIGFEALTFAFAWAQL